MHRTGAIVVLIYTVVLAATAAFAAPVQANLVTNGGFGLNDPVMDERAVAFGGCSSLSSCNRRSRLRRRSRGLRAARREYRRLGARRMAHRSDGRARARPRRRYAG